MTGEVGEDELPEEDLIATYGGKAVTSVEDVISTIDRKTAYKPWHHPVKQIVRKRQWAALTRRLLNDRADASAKLRYFTLPGPDLLDVRVLSEICHPLGVQIEYFGFDVAAEARPDAGDEPAQVGGWINAESALRQSGRISSDALILPDRLEDLAVEASQAASQLRQRPPFDVINIDACDHLAYRPPGRARNTFDALGALLEHQMGSRTPWLLFITTRAEPSLLGEPQLAFQQAISQNLQAAKGFGQKLAETLEAEEAKLGSAIAGAWNTPGFKFLKLYSVGLAKFLLQFFHSQPNVPANVELASCYAYRVHSEEPDMLALAFRVIPDRPRVYAPGVGGALMVPNLEPERAERVATRAARLQDLDKALEDEPDVREEAISGTESLLFAANYDLTGWKAWLAQHARRPMKVT
ncbi:MAG: hypothetical protein KAG89_12215 [Fulvimarina manganoxydans]|uniref:PP_RS20740 family protein n=1 Tax=Fulvimarina manganoxydans TaxID=937218 RepID=UPI00235549C0|nr:hypothetical protein [Fulvimarina manganoxydans]MCK5932923.1 hypothetical protein [Fulvimarina manganoxydans]